MMSYDFSTQAHGKWILAGEHSVVDGGLALVFPILAKTLELRYTNGRSKLSAEFFGDSGNDIHMLFWSVIEHGLELLGHSISDISGHFHLNNQIPIGAGMGASAALCVAITRWFIWQNMLEEKQLSPFARQLENLFHSQSSGLDIAGAQHNHGLVFQCGKSTPIEPSWLPIWYLSFSGQVGITSHCVKKVQSLRQSTPDRSQQIHDKMSICVEQARNSLAMQASEESLSQLANAINSARQCFIDWGLAGGHVEKHIEDLLSAGALAAKPTGSGDGGYVLSLWQTRPYSMEENMLRV